MKLVPVQYWVDEILAPLDDEQKRVIQLYLRGHHILLISAAGCGKTFTSKSLIRLLMAMYGESYFNNHVVGIASTNTIAYNMSILYFQGFSISFIIFFLYKNLFHIYFFL